MKINSLIKGADQMSKVEIFIVSNVDTNNLVFDYVREERPYLTNLVL